MTQPSLAQFLRNLNVDPSLLAAFEDDRERVLAQSGLSGTDCALLRGPDSYRMIQAARADTPANPGF